MMQQAPPRWVRLCLVAAALCPLVVAGGPEPLEDMLPHMEYARLFDAFHRWSRRNGKVYASAVEKRAALTSYYYVRAGKGVDLGRARAGPPLRLRAPSPAAHRTACPTFAAPGEQNMNFVNKCNAQSNTTGFTCAANEFAGERHEAFNAARLRKFSEFKKQYSAEATHDPSVLASVQLPDSLDWSTTGALLPVRNQVRVARQAPRPRRQRGLRPALRSLHSERPGRPPLARRRVRARAARPLLTPPPRPPCAALGLRRARAARRTRSRRRRRSSRSRPSRRAARSRSPSRCSSRARATAAAAAVCRTTPSAGCTARAASRASPRTRTPPATGARRPAAAAAAPSASALRANPSASARSRAAAILRCRPATRRCCSTRSRSSP